MKNESSNVFRFIYEKKNGSESETIVCLFNTDVITEDEVKELIQHGVSELDDRILCMPLRVYENVFNPYNEME